MDQKCLLKALCIYGIKTMCTFLLRCFDFNHCNVSVYPMTKGMSGRENKHDSLNSTPFLKSSLRKNFKYKLFYLTFVSKLCV